MSDFCAEWFFVVCAWYWLHVLALVITALFTAAPIDWSPPCRWVTCVAEREAR
jgi:hypothetical protein